MRLIGIRFPYFETNAWCLDPEKNGGNKWGTALLQGVKNNSQISDSCIYYIYIYILNENIYYTYIY